ncbi:hypothetical protein FQA39_LY09534 [Lamprigera yunnana]|nr:hypothetical protein FQA39_LY09534 [Lamprigera yunnana]
MPNMNKDKNTKKYIEEAVQLAVKAIENDMSQRKAGDRFKVPRETLQFRIFDFFMPRKRISSESREDVQESVKGFLDENPRANPFVENRHGRVWYRSFLKRPPDLSVRTPEAITAASSVISENDIRKWFAGVKDYLHRKDDDDDLDLEEITLPRTDEVIISESGLTADVIENTTLRNGLMVHIPKVYNCIYKTETFSSQVSDYHEKDIYKHEVIANGLFNGPVDNCSTEQASPKLL